MSASSVTHDPAGKRFVLKCDDPEGKDAQLCYHQVDSKTLDFWHTEVPPSQRYVRRPVARLLEQFIYASQKPNVLSFFGV